MFDTHCITETKGKVHSVDLLTYLSTNLDQSHLSVNGVGLGNFYRICRCFVSSNPDEDNTQKFLIYDTHKRIKKNIEV